MHLPTPSIINAWPAFTQDRPLRILVSACLAGQLCGVDGTSYGPAVHIQSLLAMPNVKAFAFCPEDLAFGTPRAIPDIHGGNGFAVLDGLARVLNEQGEDWTIGMISTARQMLQYAQKHEVDLALLMDMSAACGSQVISDGCRLHADRIYQRGPGVAAALLMRHRFWVVSQRDFRTLEYIWHKLDPRHALNPNAQDHHETAWYRDYFKPEVH